MDGVNSYRMLQNLPGSFRMKMWRISALKSSSECLDINEGGTAGFRSLGDWSSGFHPFIVIRNILRITIKGWNNGDAHKCV